jgi:hypothetical protein
MEPLMTRITTLKTTLNKEMNGVQLIAYFVRIRIQPLKAKASQMWNLSGLKDKSRTSEDDVPKEIV